MRIALKITLALTVWTLVVLAVQTRLNLNRELALIEQDLVRQQQLIGRALRPAIQDVWADNNLSSVQHLIQEASASEREVSLRWVWLDLGSAATLGPRVTDQAVREELLKGKEVLYRWPDVGAPERLYSYVPILSGARPAALELMQPLDSLAGYERRTLRWLGWSLAIIGISAALGAVVLGWWLVGHRVRQLVRLARSVGEGDLPGPIPIEQQDELSDLTREMNRMCELLRLSRQEREREIAKRNRALEQLRHADRLATVGTLLARVAHEVGTPLNVVTARAKMIAKGQAVGDAAAENARIIGAQADRIAQTIRGLLDFSRKDSQPRDRASLDRCVRDAAQLVETLARDREVNLSVQNNYPNLVATFDPIQIEQALANLIVNAVHAMDQGGDLTVTVERRFASPPPGRGAGGYFASISIHDTGRGIPPEDLDQIFEPFFTRKKAGEGTGLGLPIADSIVREQGGWITVESEVGKGSTFTIYLPLEIRG